jgi:thioester reductase-like protein
VESIQELLSELANKGVKLQVDGNDLHCYIPKGSLTPEMKESLQRNKLTIVTMFGKNGQNAPRGSVCLDLNAEAVLDPDIRPGVGIPLPENSASAIFLTGASGFLGAYLLRDLLTATKATVSCLVRCASEPDGVERIRKNLLKYDLWRDEFAARILAVPGDLARPMLGLKASVFENLSNTIDAVYHNGAHVNLIYPYANLKKPNVGGTEEIIRLACQGRPKSLHHISTVGIFPPVATSGVTILESDPSTCWQSLPAGYQQSKWVAERLVEIAAERGLPVRIYRPGFISGDSQTGIWNTDDFLPRLIKGCIQMGSAPASGALVDMAPVDYVSKAIVHLSLHRDEHSGPYHFVSPCYISAGEFVGILGSLGYQLNHTSYEDWRKTLLNTGKSLDNALYPLLSMFTEDTYLEHMPAFDCRHALEALKGSGISCPEIDTDLIGTYLDYFKRSGFLAA